MAKSKFPKKNGGAEQPVSGATTTTFTHAEGKLDGKPPENAMLAAPAAAESREIDTQAATSRKTRRPEIVKTESRANLVPINMEDEIRRLAYLLSERRGFEPGHETEDWLFAEREVLERYHQHSA
jgi:hypothetical protein